MATNSNNTHADQCPLYRRSSREDMSNGVSPTPVTRAPTKTRNRPCKDSLESDRIIPKIGLRSYRGIIFAQPPMQITRRAYSSETRPNSNDAECSPSTEEARRTHRTDTTHLEKRMARGSTMAGPNRVDPVICSCGSSYITSRTADQKEYTQAYKETDRMLNRSGGGEGKSHFMTHSDIAINHSNHQVIAEQPVLGQSCAIIMSDTCRQMWAEKLNRNDYISEQLHHLPIPLETGLNHLPITDFFSETYQRNLSQMTLRRLQHAISPYHAYKTFCDWGEEHSFGSEKE